MPDLRLVPFGEAHLAPFAELFDDPDVQRFTRLPLPPPPGYEHTWLSGYENGRRDGTREAFAIEDVDTGSFLGIAVAPSIDAETRTVELGYLVAPATRGRGIASQALRLLTDWAFSSLEAERIELFIGVDNPASKAVAKRCGYVFEGVMRSAYFKDGIRTDTELWSRLPSDPEP